MAAPARSRPNPPVPGARRPLRRPTVERPAAAGLARPQSRLRHGGWPDVRNRTEFGPYGTGDGLHLVAGTRHVRGNDGRWGPARAATCRCPTKGLGCDANDDPHDSHSHAGSLSAGGWRHRADQRQRHPPGTDRRLLPAVVDRRTGAVVSERDHEHDPRQRRRHRDGNALSSLHPAHSRSSGTTSFKSVSVTVTTVSRATPSTTAPRRMCSTARRRSGSRSWKRRWRR